MKKIKNNMKILYHYKTRNFYVLWHFGNLCNFNCSYCFNKTDLEKDKININFQQTKCVIKQLNKIKRLYLVNFLGGEPTVFKYCMYAIKHLNCYAMMITTNGYKTEQIKMIYDISKQYHKHIILSISLHYEKFLENKKEFYNRLKTLISLTKTKSNVNIKFSILINYKYLHLYEDLIWFLCNEEKNGNFIVHLSNVRLEATHSEFIHAYAALLKDFPKEIADKVKLEKVDMLEKHKYYHDKCGVFTNYAKVRIDGFLEHSNGCPQTIISSKSLYDNNFELSKEVKNIECCQEYAMTTSTCRFIHGEWT